MNATTLVSTQRLAEQLGAPHLLVVDCRFALEDVDWGERAYRDAHIPGARYAHLDRDLSGVKDGTNGRHPLPSPAALEKTLSSLGVESDNQVVVYDQDAGMFASRLWWLLRWAGHSRVAVLDGGFAKWMREGNPVAHDQETPSKPSSFIGRFDRRLYVDSRQVEELLRKPSARLVDARASERYRGDIEPIDRTPGHIPGAVNHPYRTNVDADGVFLDADALGASFTRTLGTSSADEVVCYCGSGVTACQNLLAMEHAGLRGARLYPGSWSEWSSVASRPVERGD